MDWELAALGTHQRYKLLVARVVPRPIALVSTRSPDGVDNAAPFSFFNLVGDDPPVVVVSIDRKGSGAVKDTGHNILATREFVCHMVDEPLLARMHRCSEEFPPDASEFDAAGLTRAPCARVAAARIAEAPVAMECRLHSHVCFDRRDLFIGEVLWLHVRDGIVDPQTLRVDGAAYAPIGRLYANLYTRTTDRIALEENAYIKELQRRGRA